LFLLISRRFLKKKKNFEWQRPDACPKCNSYKVWGHGFVLAYFDGFDEGLWIRRYRCPVCGTVIRLRPKAYFSRFQASKKTIRSSIILKQSESRWLKGVNRTRQCHWLKALQRRIFAVFGNLCPYDDLSDAFDWFVKAGVNPVSRAI